jgi:predicted ATP-binding protein involved in virulence
MSADTKNLLRIERLVLRNFRCFSECTLDLHENLTVLVAENANGKTALLDGLRIALNVFVATIGRSRSVPGFDWSDVHIKWTSDAAPQSAFLVNFTATGAIAGSQYTWDRWMSGTRQRARNSNTGIREAQIAIKNMANQAALLSDGRSTVLLPMVAYYGTGRLWNEHKLTKSKRWLASTTAARMSAYLDCLSPSSSFQTFSTWYHQMALALRDPLSTPRGQTQRPEPLLAAVRRAVQIVLEPTGWNELDWEFPRIGAERGNGFLVVEHPTKGRFPLSLLSDGVRSMVALVGDLAHRCARLNPHLSERAAEDTPGVLLIDEVDLHLHPRWQQDVLGLLQRAFPRMQIIVSTHSPQVLTTVRRENVRMISSDESGQWTIKEPKHSPLGQEPSDALAFIMGANPRPRLPLLNDIHRYEQLARAGLSESADAKQTLARLVAEGFEFNEADKTMFAFLARKTKSPNDGSHG